MTDAAYDPTRPAGGDTPLTEVVETIDAALGEPDGRGGQFSVRPEGRIVCHTCTETFAAAAVPADAVTRLEGASDPGDMNLVLPLTCPICHATGSLVVRYGPEASAEEADVLQALDRGRPSAGHPGVA